MSASYISDRLREMKPTRPPSFKKDEFVVRPDLSDVPIVQKVKRVHWDELAGCWDVVVWGSHKKSSEVLYRKATPVEIAKYRCEKGE